MCALRAIVILAAILSGCQSRSEPPDPAVDPGLAQGKAMLERAAVCEQDTARRDPESCGAACRLGHSNSCFRLGTYYESGTGVDRDEARAVALYLEACAGGSGAGCEEAARCRQDGVGGAANPTMAEELLEKSRIFHRVWCEQHLAYSCFRLGELYREGRGGPADLGVALMYYQAACEGGMNAGCIAGKAIGWQPDEGERRGR